MKRKVLLSALVLLLSLPIPGSFADVRIAGSLGAGLGVEGRKGFLGPSNTHTSFVIRADESPAYLLFVWDSKDLEPWVRIEQKGAQIVEVDLTKGNRVTLTGGGTFTLTISAHAGSGHWLCVVLGGKEWDP
ncbi:MAG TPA: hypothetical protein VMU36_06420 [Spirochaetia bacterium]|nr:hypothetical protein [Spirochaetia bacterium]